MPDYFDSKRPTFPVKKFTIILFCLVVGACSSLTAKYKDAYKSSQSLPPLKIPRDLSKPHTSDTWAIPQLDTNNRRVSGSRQSDQVLRFGAIDRN